MAHADSPDGRISALGEISELQRLLGDFDDAAATALKAGELAREVGYWALEAANPLRYATALQYGGHHADAVAVFEELLARAGEQGFAQYQHFSLQHFGKCLAELRDYDEARKCFESALKIRRAIGDASLIESTNTALAALDRLVQEVNSSAT